MIFDYENIATWLMLIFFKVLGLAPFALQRSAVSTKATERNFVSIKFSSSRIGCLYNLILIAVQFRLLFWAIPNAFTDDYPNKSTITVSIVVTTSVLGNSALLAIYLILGFRQKTGARLLNDLLSMNDSIISQNVNETQRSSQNFFVIIFLTNLIVSTGLLTTRVIAMNFPALSYFRMDWPTMIIGWYMTQYIFVIKMICNRLRAVHRVLLEHCVTHPSGDTLRLFNVREVPFDSPLASKIRKVRRIHQKLYEIASEVSEFYSLPILLAIALFCCTLIYSGYYLIIPFVTIVEKHSDVMVTCLVFFMLNSMIPIVVLATAITIFTAEMKRTLDIVRKLLIRANINEDAEIQLKEFALELMHRKVQFTACGLFSLDCTLVHSILSMVTTYLIILIQQQMGRDARIAQHQIDNNAKDK